MSELRLPAELDGSLGTNRAEDRVLQILARNDIEAITRFLHQYEMSEGTKRIYERECERLLLWAVIQRHKALSSLDLEDFDDYIRFLKKPMPASVWCAKNKQPKTSPAWRPFIGGLQDTAVGTALASANSLMGWLVDSGYLSGNPLSLMRQKNRKVVGRGRAVKATEESRKVKRLLEPEMMTAIMVAVDSLPQDTPAQRLEYERARLLVAFFYLAAPRIGDIEKATMGSFEVRRGEWWWNVIGKGGKEAKLPVPRDLSAAIMRYRGFLGKDYPPHPDEENDPLFPGYKREKSQRKGGLSARRITQILKALFKSAADKLPPGKAKERKTLLTASAHWLRHTSISDMVDAGIDQRHIQRIARHSDPRTTERYIHLNDTKWHQDAQKMRLPKKGKSNG